MNADQPTTPWKKWGPYLSERQWGTVRENYGAGGDTWNYLYEYFHGDNGAGIGASHQTGWTGLVAPLMHRFGSEGAESMHERMWKAAPPR